MHRDGWEAWRQDNEFKAEKMNDCQQEREREREREREKRRVWVEREKNSMGGDETECKGGSETGEVCTVCS